jgi:hypothetical protein
MLYVHIGAVVACLYALMVLSEQHRSVSNYTSETFVLS